ncbi:class A beta-lactamase-related serine hydrolase [Halorussus gelatinilyticus]|uniref:Class A beta-lactamase-related serine hydrolase n=1 Tax=Halorussus gelatinilyticus TaxID=2937524 RepID=A0A8U0ILU6_9EURY|nr:serine hydrolase [Halorussus gelatinilyticus]UPW02110.1 class A beta-lactamase-related serine hydrolase [Halorussus gelatinilyticus]
MRPDTPAIDRRDELVKYVESYADRLDGRLGVFLGFPRGPDEFDVVAERNAETAFAAASTIKLPILYALYDEYDGRLGDLEESREIAAENRVAGSGLYHLLDSTAPSVEDLARAMIAVSDNAATNELVDLLGMDRIEETAADLGMERTRLRRKMMSTVGDNDLELTGDWPAGEPANATAPADCARLFADLIYRTTLSDAAYDRLSVPLREQKHAMLFPRYLPMDVERAHKTGQLPSAALDTGYVEPPAGIRRGGFGRPPLRLSLQPRPCHRPRPRRPAPRLRGVRRRTRRRHRRGRRHRRNRGRGVFVAVASVGVSRGAPRARIASPN